MSMGVPLDTGIQISMFRIPNASQEETRKFGQGSLCNFARLTSAFVQALRI